MAVCLCRAPPHVDWSGRFAASATGGDSAAALQCAPLVVLFLLVLVVVLLVFVVVVLLLPLALLFALVVFRPRRVVVVVVKQVVVGAFVGASLARFPGRLLFFLSVFLRLLSLRAEPWAQCSSPSCPLCRKRSAASA